MNSFTVQRKMSDPVVECKDPSMTSQADLRDTQISSILRRYNATGVLPTVNRPVLTGNELPSDFTEACNSFTEEKFKNERNLVESASDRKSGDSNGDVSVHSEQAGSEVGSEVGSEEMK